MDLVKLQHLILKCLKMQRNLFRLFATLAEKLKIFWSLESGLYKEMETLKMKQTANIAI